MKKCFRCKDEKPLDDFCKDKNKNDSRSTQCRKCVSENKTDRCIKNSEYYKANKERIKQRDLLRNDIIIKKHRELYLKNSEIIKGKCSEYYTKNKDAINEKRRNKSAEEKSEINKFAVKYRKSNKIAAISAYTRGRIYSTLKSKGVKKKLKTIQYLGCDFEFLKRYIENQFKDGMSWDNYEKFGWHIDHIIPLASAKTESELIPLLHYTNLQPLWWYENLSKQDKLPHEYLKIAV